MKKRTLGLFFGLSIFLLPACKTGIGTQRTTKFVWMGRLDTWGMPGTPRFSVELSFNELQVIRIENGKEVDRRIVQLSESRFRDLLAMWKTVSKGNTGVELPAGSDGTSVSIAYNAGKEYYIRGWSHISSIKKDPLLDSLVKEVNELLPENAKVF
jgi:hypothetical protein